MTRAVLFHGGRIHVGDGRSAEALLARDGRVAAIGPARDLRREAPDAELIDLRGGLMTPGWVDAHVHFVWWSIQMSQLDLRDARTVDEALARVAAHARALPGGAWILGGRFDRNAWGRWPTAAELDRASAGHPAALRSRDGHSRWLNSEALRRVGIGPDTTPPAGGTILRDASGAPTGILQENANDLVDAVVPPPTDAEMLEAARHGQTEAWQRGLTGFENLDAFRDRFTLATFQRLHDAGELAMRAHIGIPRTAIDEALDRGLRTGAGDDWLRVGHLKIFTDGALGSQTAALEQPYLGTDDRGVLTVEPEELARLVARAAAGGIAVAVHAIGDRAVRVALDAIAPTRATAPALRPKIEHVQLVRADDLDRFARHGIVASMQPLHATSDRDLANRYWGAERVTRAYPWRALLSSGATLAFGSDAPVEPIDPLLGIHAAVARRRPGDAEAWTPAQRLTLDEALAGYAAGPAYALGRERELGTLATGMRCDATVVDRDLARCREDELLDARVRATVTDGVVRFADGLA
ncbi:MAG TPA: amidohydrolase [Candidatus Limnocylindria bacterium]|nr:amidohydrolase [Candidatus Limnocylindria bacterium]